MFKKPFQIKSNTQIKNSERKLLKETFRRSFTNLMEDDIENIIPKKEPIYLMKIQTSDNKTVFVYLVQKRAIAFEFDSVLFPSVYLLWKYSNLLLTFTTNPFVVSRINAGADLMLPGVVTKPGTFSENSLAYVNSTGNKAAIAVGVTALSSHDIQSTASKGKCVIIYHFYGDKLCSLEDLPILPLPQFEEPELLNCSLDNNNDFPALGEKTKQTDDNPPNLEGVLEEITINANENITEVENVTCTIDEMDNLLIYCFLAAIKYSKTLELPMLTSSFYKLEVMPICPPDKCLDIKKTSYKKVGQFLKQMTQNGVVSVKEKKKGVEMLESINREHPMLMNFYIECENRPKKRIPDDENTSSTPVVTESYIITSSVEPIFKDFGFKKGDTLKLIDLRRYITSYVKNHNLHNDENKRFVNVKDSILQLLCKNENSVTWEDLITKVCASMKPCLKVSAHGVETISKTQTQSITLTVQTRSGNKKVTLVDNLELFGIRLSEFAKECQHGVAASTSVSRPQGKKTDQLLVQGNQVLFIYNLLVEKYKIPKRYIKGLEHAVKHKK